MSRYKLTITLEVEDEHNEITEAIKREGQAYVESQFATGFLDPNFENLTCKIKKVHEATEAPPMLH